MCVFACVHACAYICVCSFSAAFAVVAAIALIVLTGLCWLNPCVLKMHDDRDVIEGPVSHAVLCLLLSGTMHYSACQLVVLKSGNELPHSAAPSGKMYAERFRFLG